MSTRKIWRIAVVAVLALTAAACGTADTATPPGADATQDVPEIVVPTSSAPATPPEGPSGVTATGEGSDAAQTAAAAGETAAAEDAAAEVAVADEQDPTSDPVFTSGTVPEGYTYIDATVEYVAVEIPDWSPPQAQQVPPMHPDTRAPSWSTLEAPVTPASLIAVSVLPADHMDADPEYPGGETPLPTVALEQFADGCLRAAAGSELLNPSDCAFMLHEMTWPLDYMGAHEGCVVGEYTLRYQRYAESGISAAPSPYGWHNCATAINPDPSDTTSSLEERCEAVLPPDVDLETRPDFLVTYHDDGTHEVEVLPSRSGATCAEWAQSLTFSDYCPMVSALATQWMQHYYGAPARSSFAVWC